MTQKPQIGIGNVPITLDGEELVLRPSYQAMASISRASGGIRGAITAVMQMDIDVIVRVVTLGLGDQARQFKNQLPEVIFRAGLTDSTGEIMGKCVEYLSMLANGGKPVPVDGDEDPPPQPQG